MKAKMIDKFYREISAEFEASLQDRTPEEAAYDEAILQELRNGRSIKQALEAAAKKFPSEALLYNDETIAQIKDHYEYLLNHEELKAKLKQLKGRSWR